MITLRRTKERQRVQRKNQQFWLTFSPKFKGNLPNDHFDVLTMLNEYFFSPGGSLEAQWLLDVETITYVRKGTLAQEDSTGQSGVLRAGEFQRVTTGLRVRYSKRNASQTNEAQAFGMTLRSAKAALDYGREQVFFSVADRSGGLCVVASQDGRRGSLCLHQDVLIYSAILHPGQHVVHEMKEGRCAWLHVVSGEGMLGDYVLVEGDGAGVTAEPAVSFTARKETEILLIDLPGISH